MEKKIMKEELSDEMHEKIRSMSVELMAHMIEIGRAKNMGPLVYIPAVGFMLFGVIITQVKSKDLESARFLLDRLKSSILNMLSEEGFK